jgi:hypothetical protein
MDGYPEVRPTVVAELMAVLTDETVPLVDRIDRATELDASDRERAVAIRQLVGLAAAETSAAHENMERAGFRWTPPRSPLLHATYEDLKRIVARAAAISFVLDRLGPVWSSWPNRPLIDVLKTLRRSQLAQLAKALRSVGLHDLDELIADDG